MSLLDLIEILQGRTREVRAYGRLMSIITPLLMLTFVICLVSFQLLHFTFARASMARGSGASGGKHSVPPTRDRSDSITASEQIGLVITLQPRNQKDLDRIYRCHHIQVCASRTH